MTGLARSFKPIAALVLVIASTAVVWCLLSPGSAPTEMITPGSRESESTGVSSVERVDSELPHLTQADDRADAAIDAHDAERKPRLYPVLEGKVVGDDGGPIVGALVTWTTVETDRVLPEVATTPEWRRNLAEDSSHAITDESGGFAFTQAPREVAGGLSVLWATAHGYEGRWFCFNGAPVIAPVIALPSGIARDVRVVDTEGSPVAGAQVEQFGSQAVDRKSGDQEKVAVGKVFRRMAVTDLDGRPQPPLYPVPAGESIQAALEGLSSDTWLEPRNESRDTIVLVVSPSFSSYGQITSDEPSFRLEGLVVDAVAYHGTYSGSLAAATVRADGSWGPIHVPCREGWEYSLVLSGRGVARDRVVLGSPSPGDLIRRDFHAVAELVLPVSVTDDQGKVVADATCTALWAVGDFAMSANGRTGLDGIARVLGVRPGWIQLSASADGYTKHTGDWLELSAPLEAPLAIQLAPSRRIRGRVTHDGDPIDRFKIVWWTEQSILTSVSWEVDFADRQDGTFELDSAPRERIWLMASAAGFSRSQFVRAEVGSEGEILLELLPSCRATGRVVDAQTLDPIPGSSVLLYMNRGNQYLKPRQMPVVVDAQGEFELEGLAPGDNRLVVEAPGYSRYLGVAFGSAERVADVGAISMQRTRTLELALVSHAPMDFGSFTATLKGTRYHDPTSFDMDGVARFDNVSPGIATWEVHGPDGFFRREIHMLHPDVEWVFEVDVDVGPVLEIQVVSPSGDQIPRGIEMTVFGPSPSGLNIPGLESIVRATADDEGRAYVRCLRPGPVAIEAFSPDGTSGAAASGILEMEGSRIEIMWKASPHTFRVLDASGQSVSEADVFLFEPVPGSTWNTMDATDAQGEATFYVFPRDDIFVGVKHPELGMIPARPLRLSQEMGTTVLRYGEIAGLDLVLLEGGAPSAGTQVSLFTGGFRFVVGDIASDGEGRLRWPNLAEGTYSMRVVHPGFWPGHAQVQTSTGGEPTPVTIHRSGSATLKLVSGGNSPLSGQELELEHVGLGEGPALWAELGLLPSGATLSDAQGRIELDGWPRGTYRWSAPRADGPPATGQFELAPGANPEIELRIP